MIFTYFFYKNRVISWKSSIKCLYKEASHRLILEVITVRTAEWNQSLRASDTLLSEDLQKATDLESLSFSQLGWRLNQVPSEFFQQIFLDLVTQIH